MVNKRVPLRKCLGCQIMKPKKELIRVVKFEENISVDKTGKKSGRGAYICNDIECFRKAKKAKGFERAFSCKIENEIYDTLEQELINE